MTTERRPLLWVVLADGAHARVVIPVEAEGQFATVQTFDAASPLATAAESGADRHDHDKRKFAIQVAETVNEHERKKSFDKLVIVAAGHTLHDLREALSPAATAKMVGSLTKDLLKTPDHDLMSHLAEWWAAPDPVVA